MKFEINNRWSGAVKVTCDLSAEIAGKSYSAQLGFAVRVACESDANLCDADLCDANLRDADLRGANLRGAENAELAIAKTRILPDGDLIGWKKCRFGVIVKLRIPEAAKRCHAFGRKCRAEYADVLEVFNGDKGISTHDGKTEYVVGARIVPDAFDPEWTRECSNGVHFFITRLEAEDYA